MASTGDQIAQQITGGETEQHRRPGHRRRRNGFITPVCRSAASPAPVIDEPNATVWTKIPAISIAVDPPGTLMEPPNTYANSSTNMMGWSSVEAVRPAPVASG